MCLAPTAVTAQGWSPLCSVGGGRKQHVMINWLLQSNAVCTKIFNEYVVKIKPIKETVIQFYWFIFQFRKLTHKLP